MGIEILVGAALLGAGASAYQAYDASKDAKKDAAKQAALIKKQEDMIAKERDKQAKEAAARRMRSQEQELLTGTETGLTGEPKTTLLAGDK